MSSAVGSVDEKSAGRERSGKTHRVWPAVFLGLVVSLTVFLVLDRQEQRRDEAEFHRQIATYMGTVQEHRNGSEDLLRTLRALFFQDPKLGRQLFTNAVQDLAIRMDGMQAIAWAPRVSGAARANFEREVRLEGLAGFQIVDGELAYSRRPKRAGDRSEYYPVLYIEPTAGNEAVLGYDLASRAAVRELFVRAHKEGGAEVSGPLSLPYKHAFKTGLLAVMPVYFPEFVPASREERMRQNQGFVIAVFIVDELMKSIAARTPDLRLDVMLLDCDEAAPDTAMGLRLGGQTLPQISPADVAQFRRHPHLLQKVNIGGLKVGFDFRRSEHWDRGPGRWVPAGALVIGLLLTGIVSFGVRSSSERARQVEAMVHVRTAELAQANARLKAEVGERIEAQNQLAHEHNLLHVLLNRLPDPVHVVDREGRYRLANDAHARLLHQADPAAFLGQAVRQVGPAPLAETLVAGSEEVFLSGHAIIGREAAVDLGDHQVLSLELSKLPMRDRHGQVDSLLVISRDVTQVRRSEAEQRELARRLQETQKLESLGIIAGGIAHDFNNLLTIILGNANIARLELPPDSNIRQCLGRIEDTSLRAADLCKQMLAYSGKGLFLIRRLDLSQLVQEMSELLQLSVNKKVTLRFQLTSPLPSVLADATQLQQILMNLVTNASEAIGDQEGVICVRSGLVQVDLKAVRSFSPPSDIAEGEYVFLEVTDTGCGMTPEIRQRIFDPFFSTKFTGRGLGLAAVLGIVRSHRGAITVQSEPGGGSAFRLLLPPVEGSADEESRPLALDTDWKGHGTILLAEDEAGVRITTADLLRAGGFSVDVAENGRTAIDKYRLASDRYRAVLLDFTMPDGDGEEAFQEIRQIRPNAPILIMSGYSPQQVLDRFRGKGLNGFIQKPFQAKDLMEALRRALEIRPGEGPSAPARTDL